MNSGPATELNQECQRRGIFVATEVRAITGVHVSRLRICEMTLEW